MSLAPKSETTPQAKTGPALDFQDHLRRLDELGLVVRVDRPIDKDTELHPLVRWQFQGGIPNDKRRAFVFTNVVDSKGHKYDMPVVLGALASSPQIYALGMGVEESEIGDVWLNAINNPIAPVEVINAPCQEVVITGDELKETGLSALPVPNSTPGFDASVYLAATLCVTKDPDTNVRNMGTYRAALKANDRLGVRMASRIGGAGGYYNWQKYNKRKERMPVAFVIGCAPVVFFTGPQKLKIGQDELAVAGGLAGQAIREVKCKTVDLMVPADSEIVIEGFVDPELLEPEGPFGESHGHVALEDFNMSMEVTAITMKKKPVFVSIVSQVTPSESSTTKKVAYEPLYLSHLKDTLNVRGIKRVVMHEPLTNVRPVIFLQFAFDTPQSEVWRGLQGATSLQAQCGKVCIAVSEDVDPHNTDAVLWSIAYRSNIATDLLIVPFKSGGHGPKGARHSDSALLIDATLKGKLTPLALPAREFMENARKIWEELDLPQLSPQPPWFGYSLGDWNDKWALWASRATTGDWAETGEETFTERLGGITPETPVRSVKK